MLSPYDTELSHADPSFISGASALHESATQNQQETDSIATANGTHMTETAARHILVSVTRKVKRLFVLLGARQLESMDEAVDAAGTNAQQYTLGYAIQCCEGQFHRHERYSNAFFAGG